MTNLLELKKPNFDYTGAIQIIDDIKQKLVSGEFKCLLIVGITPDHDTAQYQLGVEGTSNLEILGAISVMQQSFYDERD